LAAQSLSLLDRLKKSREDFVKMLESAEDLSRFSKARELFEDDPRWRVRCIPKNTRVFNMAPVYNRGGHTVGSAEIRSHGHFRNSSLLFGSDAW
jgi:FF domain